MQGISRGQLLLTSSEAWRKEAKEQKLVLLDKQRNLGDNHPETLDAMGYLAWLHHELGKFSSARDLRATVLETFQILLGEDDPRTLLAMNPLGITQLALGEYKEAQKILELALEKQRKVLGGNHPETARTLSSLAIAYVGNF
jgi:tetratricopeptide (TPR) repeat protein